MEPRERLLNEMKAIRALLVTHDPVCLADAGMRLEAVHRELKGMSARGTNGPGSDTWLQAIRQEGLRAMALIQSALNYMRGLRSVDALASGAYGRTGLLTRFDTPNRLLIRL
jgi:hypothetical protein